MSVNKGPTYNTFDLIYRQGSGESSFSQCSLDLNLDEEKEHYRRNAESQALVQLEKGYSKPVAFAVKTNVAFDGSVDDDSPAQGYAISFGIGDYLHIMERYDQNWWIGRKVMQGTDIGFIPSPAKLELLRTQTSQNKSTKNHSSKGSPAANLNKFLMKSRDLNKNGSGMLAHSPVSEECEDPLQSGDLEAVTNASSSNCPPIVSSLVEQESKKKGLLGKKQEQVPPYDVVPSMRPVVIIGPSLKGYEVTDMMQKALFEHLRRHFQNRVLITRVSADISLSKKNGQNSLSKRPLMERANSHAINMVEVQNEIERIFELTKTLQLVVLDCDTINHPSQLIKTSLNPILVYLQISSQKVLQRLIKSRGKSQSRNMNVQLVAAEKLTQCPLDMWDIMLQENNLEEASQHLIEVLEEYWLATHPPIRPPQVGSAAHKLLVGTSSGGGPSHPNLHAHSGHTTRHHRRSFREKPKPSVVNPRIDKLGKDHGKQETVAHHQQEEE